MPKDVVDKVVGSLAKRFGVTTADVFGATRSPEANIARHLALLICWRVAGISQADIATRFGRRHTGVAYGATRASQLLVQDPMVYRTALDVLQELGLPRQALPVRNGSDGGDRGLVAVHARTEGQMSFFARVSEATRIDMALTSGSHLLAALARQLEAAVSNGCTVRLVLTDPSLADRPDGHGTHWCGDSDLRSLLEWSFAQLRALKLGFVQGAATGTMEVRLRSRPPTCNLIILDDAVARWTPLLPMQDTKESPSLDFANVDGSIFPQLREAFESIWGDDKFTRTDPDLSYCGSGALQQLARTRRPKKPAARH
jgi:hypothetical protein